MSQNIISVQNLIKQVNAVDRESGKTIDILTGVNLEIKYAESVAIVGASGSGKSTLLGLLAGLDEASSGEISIHQQKLSQLNEDQRARLRSESVGFIFQSFQLLPSLTALENVMFPLELQGDARAAEKARQLLNRVGLEQRYAHYPRQLSGGEQQRVAIARAFVTEPQLLFADEPTGNLDKATGETIINLLFEMNQEKHTTLVIVTHDDTLAQRCERRLVLQNGQLHHVE